MNLFLPERFKSFFSASNPVFLALLVIILLGISLSLTLQTKIASKTPSINFEEVNFPSLVWKNRTLKNLNLAVQEKNINKRFELYQNIFRDLKATYIGDHSSQSRIQVQTLAQFIAQEFPTLYNQKNFIIPCLDLACGTPQYPADISEIKSKIQVITSMEPLVLDSILKKFEAAALAADREDQWQNYLLAFSAIKSESQRTGDLKITQIGLKLKEFLKTEYPAKYSEAEQRIPDILKI